MSCLFCSVLARSFDVVAFFVNGMAHRDTPVPCCTTHGKTLLSEAARRGISVRIVKVA